MMHLMANLDGLVVIIFAILFGPPIVFVLIGTLMYQKNKKDAKGFFIAALVYLLIGGGFCASLMI